MNKNVLISKYIPKRHHISDELVEYVNQSCFMFAKAGVVDFTNKPDAWYEAEIDLLYYKMKENEGIVDHYVVHFQYGFSDYEQYDGAPVSMFESVRIYKENNNYLTIASEDYNNRVL